MDKDISGYRKSYEKEELLESTIESNPLDQFEKWFKSADENDSIEEPNAMTLSTVGLDGFPRGRVVLLKRFDEHGFVFYTNYDSQKGESIDANNHVCISFFWPAEERQIIIKGKVSRTSEKDSSDYFNSRPKGSQLGALVSNQSQPIESRTELDNKLEKLKLYYEGKDIPKPDNWGGYLVQPIEYEFWQGRQNRLHDRIKYVQKSEDNWSIIRLSP